MQIEFQHRFMHSFRQNLAEKPYENKGKLKHDSYAITKP